MKNYIKTPLLQITNTKLKTVILIGLIAFISCKKEGSPAMYKEDIEINAQPKIAYSTFKKKITSQKALLKKESVRKISDFLYKCINEDIYNYWHKTPWNFNGTTSEPQKGTIACGYFVTNTLSDLGFNIQRIKLAQQPSSVMIKKLCTNIQYFSSVNQLQEYLNKQPDKSVYIIGLDFHTGYVLKDETGSYFLHSNYIKNEGVVKEALTQSSNLKSSKSFMIGSLTANKTLLNEWVNN